MSSALADEATAGSGPPAGSGPARRRVDLPVPHLGSLSPSRAGDFMTCPLLYRFRVVDRLPQRPSAVATRGTVVHAVLERLFDLPAAERTVDRARDLVAPEWERLLAESPELGSLFASRDDSTGTAPDIAPHPGGAGAQGVTDLDPEAVEQWLASGRDLLDRYFALEDPTRLEPAERELYVETQLDAGLVLRGYVDRLDVAPDGAMRVVDYKTGKAPREIFEAKALFQMRFYALVLWRLHGRVPRLLQLLYLGSGEVLRYQPDEADLRATERKLLALWQAIQRAASTGDWRASPSRLCDWCDHRALCPEWGGTPPPLPVQVPVAGERPAEEELPSPRGRPEDA